MSIIAFCGLPGSGKSYGVVENVILPALRENRTIYTNIPLNLEEVNKEFPGAPVHIIDNVEEYASGEKFFEMEKGCIIVLDEVWRLWRSGLRANNAPVKAIEFFAEHRHMVGDNGKTTEIVLVTQDLAQVAAFSRQLVEKTYISRKLSAIGAKNHYRVDVYMGMVTGQKGPELKLTGVIRGRYKPEIYRFYKSHTKNEGTVAGVEEIADDRGVVWKHPLIMIGVPFGVIMVLVALFYSGSFFSSFDEKHNHASVEAKAAAKTKEQLLAEVNARRAERGKPAIERVVQAGEVVEVSTADLRLSKRWRLVGMIQRENGTGQAIARDWDGNVRTIDLKMCKFVEFVGECDVGDERVTNYSGIRSSFLPSLVSQPKS